MSKILRSKLKPMRRWDSLMWTNIDYSKKKYPPGQQGKNGYRFNSGYCSDLRAKQAFKYSFLVSERRLKSLCRKIKSKRKLNFSNALTENLELMPFRILYNCGFSPSVFAAKQLISHRHFLLNDRAINLPRMLLKPGDVLSVKERSKGVVKVIKKRSDSMPQYLEVDENSMKITVLRVPVADEISLGFEPNFTVLASFY